MARVYGPSERLQIDLLAELRWISETIDGDSPVGERRLTA